MEELRAYHPARMAVSVRICFDSILSMMTEPLFGGSLFHPLTFENQSNGLVHLSIGALVLKCLLESSHKRVTFGRGTGYLIHLGSMFFSPIRDAIS